MGTELGPTGTGPQGGQVSPEAPSPPGKQGRGQGEATQPPALLASSREDALRPLAVELVVMDADGAWSSA